jgi:multimeric flavodoxin WrbA
MAQIYAALAEAELLALATPLYYFGFSAQIKAAIDRLFAINASLKNRDKSTLKSTLLLAVCGDEEAAAMDGLRENYRLICSYLGLKNAGEILASGVYDIGDIAGHPALTAARNLAAAL